MQLVIISTQSMRLGNEKGNSSEKKVRRIFFIKGYCPRNASRNGTGFTNMNPFSYSLVKLMDLLIESFRHSDRKVRPYRCMVEAF